MNHNQLLLVTFFGAIALFAPAPRAIFAETSPPIIAQSAELQEAERLTQQLFQLYQQGNYPEAISLAEKVLAIYEKQLGKLLVELDRYSNSRMGEAHEERSPPYPCLRGE